MIEKIHTLFFMKKIIFGTRQIGWPPSYKACPLEKAAEILSYSFQKGIRSFDSAPIYGNGKSEAILWDFISKNGLRDEVEIITKFGFSLEKNGTSIFDFRPAGIQKQLEESLSRLKTDYIDMYLLHIPQKTLNIGEILGTLNTLKREWKILSYGLCNTYGKQLQEFLAHRESHIEYIEDFYNILERKAEKLIFPYLQKQKFLAYGPLYRGFLTDIDIKILLEKQEDGIKRLLKHDGLPWLLRQRKILEEVAKRKNTSLEKLALEFLEKSDTVESIIFGTTNKEHLDIFLKNLKPS